MICHFAARGSVEDRAALPIGTKLYFTGGQFDGFPCMQSALASYHDVDTGCEGDGSEIEIKVRRLLAIVSCAVVFDQAPTSGRRLLHRWSYHPPRVADYFEACNFGTTWRGSSNAEDTLPDWRVSKKDATARVACWATTATVRYVWRLQYVETVLRSEEVSRAIQMEGVAA